MKKILLKYGLVIGLVSVVGAVIGHGLGVKYTTDGSAPEGVRVLSTETTLFGQ